MNPGCIPIIDMKKTSGEKPLDEIARRLLCGCLGHVTWVHTPEEVDEDNGKFLIMDRESLLDFLNDPVTHSVYFNEYILPVAKENTVQEILAWLDNLASFDQGLSDDTKWLAQVMCGLAPAPQEEELADASSEEVEKANALVIAVHKATETNGTSVKPYVLASLSCIPGLKKTGPSSKGKRTKLQNFEEAVSKTSLPLFLWDEAAHEYKRMLLDYDKFATAYNRHGGAQVFGAWSDWGDVLTLRAKQTENRAKARVDSLDRFFEDLWKTPANAKKNEAHIFKEDCMLSALVHGARMVRHAETAADEDGSLGKLIQKVQAALDEQPDQEGFAMLRERYVKKAVYGRSFGEDFRASLQGQSSEVMDAAFCGHSIDADIADCYGRILVRLLRRHGIFDEEKHGYIRRSTMHFREWRQAVADILGVDLNTAKKEILRVRFGGCARQDIPFLRVLAAQIDSAVDDILQLEENSWVLSEYGERPNPRYSRLAAIMSFEERELMARISTRMAQVGCPMYCLKHDGGIFGVCPAYKRLFALDAMQELSNEMDVDVVHKPFASDAKYPFGRVPAALVRKQKFVADPWQLGHLPGKSMCLYNTVSFLSPDSLQTVGAGALVLFRRFFVIARN